MFSRAIRLLRRAVASLDDPCARRGLLLCSLLAVLGSLPSPGQAQTTLTYTPGTFTLPQGNSLNIGPLVLTMQNDGNLVLSNGGSVVWSTGTGGHNCGTNQCVAKFQHTGELDVLNGNTPLWGANVSGTNDLGAVLVLSTQLPYIEIVDTQIKFASSYQFSAGNLTIRQGAPLNMSDGFSLTMQDDGNLVLYWNLKAVWSTGTYATNCANQCVAQFQSDGNFVVYNGSTPLWDSKTFGNPAATFVLSQRAPYLTVVGPNQAPLYASSYQLSTGGFTLSQGSSLNLGPLAVTLQTDGNLVLSQNGVNLWSTGLSGQSCANQCVAKFQTDGNLVVYNGSTALWNSNSFGNPAATLAFSAESPHIQVISPTRSILYANYYLFSAGALVLHAGDSVNMGPVVLSMQTDGNLVLYRNGTAAWNIGLPKQACLGQCVASFQSDGNFVVANPAGTYWASKTAGDPAATLAIFDQAQYMLIDSSIPTRREVSLFAMASDPPVGGHILNILMIHGRKFRLVPHTGTFNFDQMGYWGGLQPATAGNVVYVQWDSLLQPFDSPFPGGGEAVIADAVNNYCDFFPGAAGDDPDDPTAPSCIIICHSAGCAAFENYLAKSNYYNNNLVFHYVIAAGSAAGGSEVANKIRWVGFPIDRSLTTTYARGAYNHNSYYVYIRAIAGTGSPNFSTCIGIFPKGGAPPNNGDCNSCPGILSAYSECHDGLVALHSSCGHNRNDFFEDCNDAVPSPLHLPQDNAGTFIGHSWWLPHDGADGLKLVSGVTPPSIAGPYSPEGQFTYNAQFHTYRVTHRGLKQLAIKEYNACPNSFCP